MELTQEHRALIEKIVRNNPRFSGNEDLLDDFCSETFKRSYSIVCSIDDIRNLEAYLNKISSSAILQVLKNLGRVIKSKSGYKKIQEISVSAPNVYNVDDEGYLLFDLPDPAPHFEEKIIRQDEIKSIHDAVLKIDSREKSKKFYELFYLRYIKGFNQAEIASTIGVSQGEVSKRILELSKKINVYLMES